MAVQNVNARQTINFQPRYAHVVGWGMAVPENVMTNEDLSAIVETNHEWIKSRTGISERRIANENESTTSLSYKAAQNALEVADVLPIDLDLIIVATSTPDFVFPSTASMIQDMLGASKAGGFDLAAACSGFVYAMNMGADAIRAGSADTVLVVGAETMSRVLDWQDRSTCILFGDGAGAIVLQASEERGGVLSSVLRSDGSGSDLLAIPTTNNPAPGEHAFNKMYMEGREVFKFATRVVDESIRQAVERAGIEIEDIDLVVPHQANMRILQSASKKLSIPIERFVSNVDRYGNTSAASIPIALCEAIEAGRIKVGHHLAMVGFGGGLSWASMVIEWAVAKPSKQQSSRINRQRRQFAYQVSRWRTQIQRWRRNLSRNLRRFLPRSGRSVRLRDRADKNQDF